MSSPPTFRDDFDGADLDPEVWLASYLPVWSSTADTRATYAVADSWLTLSVPPEQGLWCPDTHPGPLRVSGIQSGSRSGPVGSSSGQQAFAPGLRVREAQPRFEGWLVGGGRVAIRCRMEVSPRSMAAMWLSGFEDDPADAGELCVVEVFGSSVLADATAEIGVGVKQLGDPRLPQDFVPARLDLDVSEPHTYEVVWGDDGATFSVDGETVHTTAVAPRYPMQSMVAVFDFPDRGSDSDAHLVPVLSVDWIEHTAEP